MYRFSIFFLLYACLFVIHLYYHSISQSIKALISVKQNVIDYSVMNKDVHCVVGRFLHLKLDFSNTKPSCHTYQATMHTSFVIGLSCRS